MNHCGKPRTIEFRPVQLLRKFNDEDQYRSQECFYQEKKITFDKQLSLKLRKKLIKWYIRNIALYGSQTWRLRNTEK